MPVLRLRIYYFNGCLQHSECFIPKFYVIFLDCSPKFLTKFIFTEIFLLFLLMGSLLKAMHHHSQYGAEMVDEQVVMCYVVMDKTLLELEPKYLILIFISIPELIYWKWFFLNHLQFITVTFQPPTVKYVTFPQPLINTLDFPKTYVTWRHPEITK